jgi:hypothetical protein
VVQIYLDQEKLLTMVSDHYIKTIKDILYETCTEYKYTPRYEIYNLFEAKVKSGMAKYRFERTLTDLINANIISGYKIKMGRNGGIAKIEPIERIILNCSMGQFSGCISSSHLLMFLETLVGKQDR